MPQQTEISNRKDLISEAYYEWREAANAWSMLYDRLKQDPTGVSLKQRKILRSLEMRLNQASDKYTKQRLSARQTRA